MAEAMHSGIDELARFARGLQDDLSAITAGLILEWNNGVTEGQIHRLKLVKRQGYGPGRLCPVTAARAARGLGLTPGSSDPCHGLTNGPGLLGRGQPRDWP